MATKPEQCNLHEILPKNKVQKEYRYPETTKHIIKVRDLITDLVNVTGSDNTFCNIVEDLLKHWEHCVGKKRALRMLTKIENLCKDAIREIKTDQILRALEEESQTK